MISTNLIKPQEIFDRIDPKQLVKEIEPVLKEAVDDIARELAAEYYPGLWEAMPEQVRRLLIAELKSEAPKYAEAAVRDVQARVTDVLDLRQMVIDNLTRDRDLLNRMIRDIGGPDLKKIPVMGFWFGGLIGVVMAVAWAIFHNPWILPFMGLANGWVTDYVALQMLFRPHEPKRYFGLFKWQGLFAKRRHEVIPQYGKLIATELLTPDKIVDALLRGPYTDKLFELAAKHVAGRRLRSRPGQADRHRGRRHRAVAGDEACRRGEGLRARREGREGGARLRHAGHGRREHGGRANDEADAGAVREPAAARGEGGRAAGHRGRRRPRIHGRRTAGHRHRADRAGLLVLSRRLVPALTGIAWTIVPVR